MTKTLPTIAHILNDFFEGKLAAKKGLSRSRIEQVERELRSCLEAEAERILVTGDLIVLAAERQFHPEDAVARTMHADDLIFVLTIFTTDPWLPEDRTQRRVHLTIVEALTANILNRRLVNQDDLCCPLLDLRCAIDRERGNLSGERRASRVLKGQL